MNEKDIETPEINPESPEPVKTPEIKPKAPPVAVALISLFLIFLLYQGMGGIITIVILGADVSKSDPTLFRLMTIAGQMLFILLPTLIIARFVYEDVTSIIRFRLPKPKELGLFLLGFILITPIIQNVTYIQTWVIENLAKNNAAVKQAKDFFDSMDKMVGDSYTFIFSVKSFIDVFIIVIAVAITPAICEEFFFRGLIQKSFELKWKPATSIIVTSLVFALYHFSPYGLVPLFMLSAFLGYAAYKTNSILVPAGIHFANNFFMIILYYIVGDEAVNAKPESNVSIGSYFLFLFINIIFFLVWLYFLRKFYRKPETS
jgi:uncharacterized protein